MHTPEAAIRRFVEEVLANISKYMANVRAGGVKVTTGQFKKFHERLWGDPSCCLKYFACNIAKEMERRGFVLVEKRPPGRKGRRHTVFIFVKASP